MRTAQRKKLARKNHTLRESTRSVQIGFSGGKCCNVIDQSRYHFEGLRNNDEFILYRGQREEDNICANCYKLRRDPSTRALFNRSYAYDNLK